MDIISSIRNRASKNIKKIVLPRSSDERVVKAAEFLKRSKLAEPVLIANSEVDAYPNGIEVIDSVTSPFMEEFAQMFYQKRKHKGLSLEQAKEIAADPLYFGALMVSSGKADGCVAGSVSTTGEVLRTAIQVIGLKEGSDVVSSIFLMSFDDGKVYSYGDCAVVPYPNAEQLATIAIDSSETHFKITGQSANTSMLSFSTKGSAKHERTELVQQALDLVRSKNEKLNVDGELQFDASIIPEIAERKAPESKVAGKANVFIFPNLDAGNIAYKITERLAGATATGPVIQGLAKPMMDLSRGCSWEDIVNTACVCALMGD